MFEKHRTYFTLLTGIAVTVLLLVSLGLIMIYSSSTLKAIQLFNDPYIFVKKQAFAVMAGVTLFALIQTIPYRWIESFNLPLLVFSVLCLALILIPGLYVSVGGAERWLSVAGYRIQPAEIIKVSFIIFLARVFSLKSFNPSHFKSSILPVVGVFGVICLLLSLQKDFGTILILTAVTGIMLFLANLPLRYIVTLAGACIAGLGILIIVEPYRVQRLVSFLDPWSQFQGGGFQIVQSFLAFHNGGVFGAGLGASKQKLFFLPEAHTDFILAVIGEELGLLGILLILAAFAFVCYLGFLISGQQVTASKKFLGYGLTSLLTVQATLNMGVTMGLLPTKGLPLPFISSGMTSLLTFFVVAALLARLAREIPEPRHA